MPSNLGDTPFNRRAVSRTGRRYSDPPPTIRATRSLQPDSMAVIDHRSFPHIIDLIWQHLDYEGQLAARGVCSLWRDRADSRLRYLIFDSQATGGSDVTVLSHDLANPSAPATRLGSFVLWVADRDLFQKLMVPIISSGRVDNVERKDVLVEHHLQAAILQSCRTIDFVGFGRAFTTPPTSVFIDHQKSRFDNCTLRWFEEIWSSRDPDAPGLELPSTRVDVLMLEIRPEYTVQMPWDSQLCKRRRQITVNYTCYADPAVISWSDSGLRYEKLYNIEIPVVAIFHKRLDTAAGSDQGTWKAGVIGEYANLVHLGCTVDIVGLEEFLDPVARARYIKLVEDEVMRARYMYEDEDSEDSEFSDGAEYTEPAKYWWSPERENLERLRFWTHAEYEAHVGVETYRIQTVR